MKNFLMRETDLVGVQSIYSKGELIYRDRQTMIQGKTDQTHKVERKTKNME